MVKNINLKINIKYKIYKNRKLYIKIKLKVYKNTCKNIFFYYFYDIVLSFLNELIIAISKLREIHNNRETITL